jgi:hypothetical protein
VVQGQGPSATAVVRPGALVDVRGGQRLLVQVGGVAVLPMCSRLTTQLYPVSQYAARCGHLLDPGNTAAMLQVATTSRSSWFKYKALLIHLYLVTAPAQPAWLGMLFNQHAPASALCMHNAVEALDAVAAQPQATNSGLVPGAGSAQRAHHSTRKRPLSLIGEESSALTEGGATVGGPGGMRAGTILEGAAEGESGEEDEDEEGAGSEGEEEGEVDSRRRDRAGSVGPAGTLGEGPTPQRRRRSHRRGE